MSSPLPSVPAPDPSNAIAIASNTTGIKRVREDEEDVSGEVLEEQQPDFKRFKTDPAFAVATIAGAPSPAVTAVEFARPDPVTPNATFAVPPPVHVSSLAADDAMDVVPSSPSSSASIAVTGPSSETSSQPSQITLTPIASQPSGRFVHTSPGAMAAAAALASMPPGTADASMSLPAPSFSRDSSMVAEKSFALPEDAGLETVLLALTDLGNSFEAGDSERVSMPSLSASEMEKIRELSPVKVSHQSSAEQTPISKFIISSRKPLPLPGTEDRARNIITIKTQIVRAALGPLASPSGKRSITTIAAANPNPLNSSFTQKQDRRSYDPSIPVPADIKKCNCKNSRCLKLYCECFRARVYCLDCNCIQCWNTPQNADKVRSSMNYALERNPGAFTSKSEPERMGDSKVVPKGCKCSKTGCLKNYCECFHAGVYCTSNCRCFGCKNVEGGLAELVQMRKEAREQHQRNKRRESPLAQFEKQQDKIAFVQYGLPNRSYPTEAPAELPPLKQQVLKEDKPRTKSPKRMKSGVTKAVLDKSGPEQLISLANELLSATRLPPPTDAAVPAAPPPSASLDDAEALRRPVPSQLVEAAALGRLDSFLKDVLDRMERAPLQPPPQTQLGRSFFS